MCDNNVDWQIVFYGGAVHSFTQPDPGFSDPGAKYNEEADRRSWVAMQGLLRRDIIEYLLNARSQLGSSSPNLPVDEVGPRPGCCFPTAR
jgi:hypothetical protein